MLLNQNQDGYKFNGTFLNAGENAILQNDDIIVAYDARFIEKEGKWKTKITNFESIAQLFKVENLELKLIFETTGKGWAESIAAAIEAERN